MRILATPDGRGPTFTRTNRATRVVWGIAWLLLCRWTPPPLHRWRAAVLRLFGAQVGRGARVHASVRVWLPANLTIADGALIGPGVECYNQGHVTIGARAIVSQRAHLCASTHDIRDPDFALVLRAITIGEDAWICAEAFVGPGVRVGARAIVAARAVLFHAADAETIYRGNPAVVVRRRPPLNRNSST